LCLREIAPYKIRVVLGQFTFLKQLFREQKPGAAIEE
jgi:hypothetical protein